MFTNISKKISQPLCHITAIASLIFMSGIDSAASDIQVDKNAGSQYQPSLLKSRNDVPIVNIVKPSEQGISHNKYLDFNVGKEGVILNNSAEKTVNTQLGGVILGNQNFNGNSARLIINEVTNSSVSKSNLFGYTEIAGDNAEYILANPYGITCNDCGFINTSHVTLTTGSLQFDTQQRFQGFNVDNGKIVIEGLGLNASNVDYFDIISRATEINAAIYGDNSLKIITGRNDYDYATQEIHPLTENESIKPQFSLDASALGSMYAGKIHLVSTEEGVGVNLPADVVAKTDDLVITANGDIQYNNTFSAKNMQITSTQGNITSDGKSFANEHITLAANNKIMMDAALVQTQAGNINMRAKDLESTQGTQIISGKDLKLNTQHLLLDDGFINATNDLVINTDSFSNTDAKIIAGNQLDLTLSAYFTNVGMLSSLGDLHIKAAGLKNDTMGRIDAGKNLTINSENHELHNDGIIAANGRLNLNVAALYNQNEITTGANAEQMGDIIINALYGVHNNTPASVISSQHALTINAGGDGINNEGRISSQADMQLIAPYVNNYARINALGTLSIDAGYLQNSKTSTTTPLLFSGQDMNLYIAEQLRNYRGHIFAMNGDLSILGDASGAATQSIINEVGQIETNAGDMYITANTIDNLAFTPGISYNSVYVADQHPGAYDGNWYRIFHYEPVSTTTSEPAYIKSGRDINIDTTHLYNLSSVISAGRNLTLTGTDLRNSVPGRTIAGFSTRERRYWYERRCKGWNLWGWCIKGYENVPMSEDRWGPAQSFTVYSNTISRIMAGNNLEGLRARLTENLGYVGGHNVAIELGEKHGVFDATSALPNVELLNNEILLEQFAQNATGLFKMNPPSHRYFIVTDPELTSVDRFLQSNYFFDRLGVDLNEMVDTQIYADDLYVARLLSRSSEQYTHQRFIVDNVTTDAEQLAALFDNAVEAQQDLDLSLGVALSADAIAQLKKPIVWYVEQKIDGRTVLVPRLYLAQATLDAIVPVSAGTLAGNTVNVVGDEVQNAGQIIATDTLNIDVNSLNNETLHPERRATIQSGGALTITAENDILNKGATIKADGDVQLTSTQGSVKNITQAMTQAFGENIVSTLGDMGEIIAGGRLNINAAKAFENTAAEISAKNAAIKAKDITFNTAQLHHRSVDRKGDDYNISGSMTQAGSQLNVAENLTLDADNNITVVGSQVNVGEHANLKAGNDITIRAAENTAYNQSRTVNKKLFSSETTTKEAFNLTHTGSSFNVGGQFDSQSGNNTTVHGSDINIAGNANITVGVYTDANGKVHHNKDAQYNVISAQDHSYSHSETEKSGWSFSLKNMLAGSALNLVPIGIVSSVGSGLQYKKETITETQSATKQAGSTISVGGNLTTQSLGDTNVIASNLNVAGDAAINVGNVAVDGEQFKNEKANLNILSGKDIAYSDRTTQTTVLGGLEFDVDKNTAGVSMGKIANERVESGHSSNVASSINVGGDFIANATNDINIIGSDLSVGQSLADTEAMDQESSVTLKAGNNVTIAASEDYAFTNTTKSEAKYGLTLNLETSQDPYDPNDTLDVDEIKGANATLGMRMSTDTINNSQTQLRSSSVNALGNVSIQAGNDANLIASQLDARQDIHIDAANDINLLSAHEIQKHSENHAQLQAGLKASARQNITDTIEAIKTLAKTDWSGNEDKVNNSSKTLNAALQVSKILTGGEGSASVGFHVALEGSESHAESQNAIVSRLRSGGSIQLTSGGDTTLEGTQVDAGENISVETGGKFIMRSAQNSYNESSHRLGSEVEYDPFSQNVTVSGDGATSQAHGISHVLAAINAGGGFELKTASDASFVGAKVNADTVNMDVGGNLLVASVQNTDNAHNASASASVGTGGDFSFDVGAGFTDRAWVDEQSAIIGRSQVDVKVAGNTHLKGAVIAAENNKLNLDTGSLTFENIQDKDEGYQVGLGFTKGGDRNAQSAYGNTYRANFSMHDREQITRATLGEGGVTIAGNTTDAAQLAGLNRDIEKSQEMTKDMAVKPIDISVTTWSNEGIVEQTKENAKKWKQRAEDVAEFAEKTKNFVAGNEFKTDEKIAQEKEIMHELVHASAEEFAQFSDYVAGNNLLTEEQLAEVAEQHGALQAQQQGIIQEIAEAENAAEAQKFLEYALENGHMTPEQAGAAMQQYNERINQEVASVMANFYSDSYAETERKINALEAQGIDTTGLRKEIQQRRQLAKTQAKRKQLEEGLKTLSNEQYNNLMVTLSQVQNQESVNYTDVFADESTRRYGSFLDALSADANAREFLNTHVVIGDRAFDKLPNETDSEAMGRVFAEQAAEFMFGNDWRSSVENNTQHSVDLTNFDFIQNAKDLAEYDKFKQTHFIIGDKVVAKDYVGQNALDSWPATRTTLLQVTDILTPISTITGRLAGVDIYGDKVDPDTVGWGETIFAVTPFGKIKKGVTMSTLMQDITKATRKIPGLDADLLEAGKFTKMRRAVFGQSGSAKQQLYRKVAEKEYDTAFNQSPFYKNLSKQDIGDLRHQKNQIDRGHINGDGQGRNSYYYNPGRQRVNEYMKINDQWKKVPVRDEEGKIMRQHTKELDHAHNNRAKDNKQHNETSILLPKAEHRNKTRMQMDPRYPKSFE